MMLNWKDSPLGYHARVIVHGSGDDGSQIRERLSAQLDARVHGATLTVSGHDRTVLGQGDALWQVMALLEQRSPDYFAPKSRIAYECPFPSARQAFGRFESLLDELKALPGWQVTEVPL